VRQYETMNAPAVVDVFCGIGGLTHGFHLEGFEVVAGFDSDESCRFAYETNNPGATFHAKRVEDVTPEEIMTLWPQGRPRVLVGCAPCQPFSSHANKIKDKDESKWGLLYEFARLVAGTLPDVVSMENVPRLAHFKEKPVLTDFVSRLETLGYVVTWKTLQCHEYGLPQRRQRLVLFASLHGRIDPPNPTEDIPRKTVRDAIGHLPPVGAGEVVSNSPLHATQALSKENLERIGVSKQGGTWRDWPEKLRLPCHRKHSGRFYSSVYGRMSWDEPSPTMTTQFFNYGAGRFGHPDQDRATTVLEAALLQTFPETYAFLPDGERVNFARLGRQIGNAVPVELGRVIARTTKNHLDLHVVR
jgi:DNA (cytosine-5)-methyltransferase 1